MVGFDTPAVEAARLIARDRLPGLLVTDADGTPRAVLPASEVVRFMVPEYVQDDPTLAGVLGDVSIQQITADLEGATVADLLPAPRAVAATKDSVPTAMMLVLWGSAALSAIVDNIPFVATMAPAVDQMVGGTGALAGRTGLWWALVLGADLGGNATAIGASANVVVAGIAKRSGHPISFWEFTRYGLVVAVVTLGIATPYLLLRY